jgi:hypothetical protein
VAIVALIAAVGGPALADQTARIARSIAGSSIKKASIPGNRLKRDSLTGKQIKESTLAKVPRAARADSATNAGHATSAGTADSATNAATSANADHAATADNALTASAVNGMTPVKIFYVTTAIDPSPTIIFDRGGLVLTATCPDGGNAGTTTVDASTRIDNSEIGGSVMNAGTTASFNSSDFDIGDGLDVQRRDLFQPYRASGRLSYATRGGSVVSIIYQFDSNYSFGSPTDHRFCDFTGTAFVS